MSDLPILGTRFLSQCMNNSNTKITVCSALYNNVSNIKNLYYSIWATTACRNDFEFIVYNDGSTIDRINDEIEEFCKVNKIKYIHGSSNRGVAHAWNRLVEASSSDIVVISNDDVRALSLNWIDQLLSAFSISDRIGLVYWCQKLVDPVTGIFRSFPGDTEELISNPEIRIVMRHNFNGAFFAIRKDAWRKIVQPDGSVGFWEDLLSYGEEIDFSSELHNLGYWIVQLPFIFEHLHSMTFSTNPEKKIRDIFSNYLPKSEFIEISNKYPDLFRYTQKPKSKMNIRQFFNNFDRMTKIRRLDYSKAMILKKWSNKRILCFSGGEYIRKMFTDGFPNALSIAIKEEVVDLPWGIDIEVLSDRIIKIIKYV